MSGILEKKSNNSIPLLILYGSQTGTALEVSEHVSRMGLRRNFLPVVIAMDDYDISNLPNEKLIIFITSTTGDGEAPDNMKNFWKFILRKSLPSDSLCNLNCGIFGLGDSSYAKYNSSARKLCTRLQQLGAKEIIQRGLGDDQSRNGMLGDFYPWIEKLWKELENLHPLPADFVIDDSPRLEAPVYKIVEYSDSSIYAKADEIIDQFFYPKPSGKNIYNVNETPFWATLEVNQKLTANDWRQDVRHFEFNITGFPSENTYQAGDIAMIQAENDPEMVQRFLDNMNLDGDKIISIVENNNDNNNNNIICHATVRKIFTCAIDIQGTPRRYFFERLSLFASDEDEKEKLEEMATAEGADLLHSYCTKEKRSYIEIFEDFPSCRPSLDRLLELIPRIQPREFSISSSGLINPNKLTLCIGVVRFLTRYRRERFGLCSTWLSKLQPGCSKVVMWIKKGTVSMPQDLNTPMIMIGPGTGIAPMRAMIQEREYLKSQDAEFLKSSPDILFFGCRHEKKDFLYEAFLNNYVQKGLLVLSTAFSRDQERKIYVQHRMKEYGDTIWDYLHNKDACIYIAGSAKQMPTDVIEALRNIARDHGGLSEKEAEMYIKILERKQRFFTEAWS